MDSERYWQERERDNLKNSLKDVKILESELKDAYIEASEAIEEKIASLFLKYANENNLTFSEANKLLTSSQYKRWRMDIKDYVDLITATGSEELLLELNTLAMKSRITRLEEMLYQIDKEINQVTMYQTEKLIKLLDNTAKESYYKTIFDNFKFKGIGASFSFIDKDFIEEVLSYPWSGANYSDRIWSNRTKLRNVIKQDITQMVIQGKGNGEVAKKVVERMNSSYSNAIRLVDTEHAYVTGQAKKKAFENLGMEKYQILATLDNKTSQMCQRLDGEIFNLNDAMVGVNYPPLHPNCRTVSVPYYDGIEGEEDTRTARNGKGKTYEIPGSMKYEEWYDKNVIKNNEREVLNEIAVTKLPGETLDDYRNKILNREYNLTINKGAQGKHIKSHNNYIEGRSYLVISMKEAQELVYKYAGTGELLESNGGWNDKELIKTDNVVGYSVNKNKNLETEVKNFIIHYGNKGTHIVPTERE